MRQSVRDTLTKKVASVNEAALITGYSKEHIRLMCRFGKLPSVKKGTDFLIDRLDLETMKKGQ